MKRALFVVLPLLLVVSYVSVPSLFMVRAAQAGLHRAYAAVTAQSKAAAGVLPKSVEADLRLARSSPPGLALNAPIILCYHDVRPDVPAGPEGDYTLSPAAFAAQMAVLKGGSYHTVTAAQLVSWLHGGALPPKPVVLTFDDGARGIWTYVDPILRRDALHAVAFVITGEVGDRPYYLSWQEIGKMAASGRWDIESHTYLTHYRGLSAAKLVQPALSTRQWLPALGRAETLAEFQRRVTSDIDRSIADIVAHGMPRPALFAYPYGSESNGPQDLAATSFVQHLIAQRFQASMLTDTTNGVLYPAQLRLGELNRFQVMESTSSAALLRALLASAERALVVQHPLSDPGSWRGPDDEYFPGPFGAGQLTLEVIPQGWLGAYFDRVHTALWTNYSVAATVGSLGGRDAGASGGLIAAIESDRRIQVSVTAASVTVKRGRDDALTVLQLPLPMAASHRLAVVVRPHALEVSVDGRTVYSDTSDPAAAPFVGGFGVMGLRQDAASPSPTVSDMVVAPVGAVDLRSLL